MKSGLFFTLVLLWMVPEAVSGQEFFLLGGISQQAMGDMKRLQQNAAINGPVQLQSTQRFPAYLQFSGGGLWRIPGDNKVGFRIFGTSTGARNYYEDYSGYIVEDYQLVNIGLTGRIEHLLILKKKSELSVFGEVGESFTRLKYDAAIRIGTSSDASVQKFKSKNLVGNLGVAYRYHLTERFFLMGTVGYEIDWAGKLSDSHGNNIYVNTTPVAAGWSGIKLLGGIGFRLRD